MIHHKHIACPSHLGRLFGCGFRTSTKFVMSSSAPLLLYHILSLLLCAQWMLASDVKQDVNLVEKGRSQAWGKLDRLVRSNQVDAFREKLHQLNSEGLLNDKDSGYYELLLSALTQKPREISHQLLHVLLRTMCSRNIIQLLPDLLPYFDLSSLLLLRKYCPVGEQNIGSVLEMMPDLLGGNPLARYLLEAWEDPQAIEFTNSQYDLSLIYNDDVAQPEPVARRGAGTDDDFDLFKNIEHNAMALKYHNIVLFAQDMSKASLAQILPALLGQIDIEEEAKITAFDWINELKGSFTLSVLIKDTFHIWRKGSGNFVVITVNDGREEVSYPLGTGFKNTSPTVEYHKVPTGNDALLIYCSGAVIERVHLHDLLGSILHSTEELEELQHALRMFYGHFIKERFVHGASNGPTFFRAFQATEQKDRRPRPRPSTKPVMRFRIKSDESLFTEDIYGAEDTRESDISLGPQFHHLHQRRKPTWSNLFESEASFDDNYGLESSSDLLFEETLFERRRWWAEGLEESKPDASHGYDSSMSRDFYYQPGATGFTLGDSFFDPSLSGQLRE